MPAPTRPSTHPPPIRLAAIDIGSNSIRLVVAEALEGGDYRVLAEGRETTRLGRSVAREGRLDDESIAASLNALRQFQSVAARHTVQVIRAVATSAIREAENGPQFCELARNQLHLPIEVISPRQEAELAFLSVSRRFDLAGMDALLVDIGGGSTEILMTAGERIEQMIATPLGAVRLSEMFGAGQSPAGEDYTRMLHWIDGELRRCMAGPAGTRQRMIGSGGTFTSLAAMTAAAGQPLARTAPADWISHADVQALLDRLRAVPRAERLGTPGLTPDRVDIIVPGLAVVDRIMTHFRIDRLQIHPYGVRDGLLMSMIDRGAQAGASPGAGADGDGQ
jgi:exopolyphosphatase/guanosine-5'-triphosphate,3'-diphosphate pyrophosphatase